jgi:hypothetical protein
MLSAVPAGTGKTPTESPHKTPGRRAIAVMLAPLLSIQPFCPVTIAQPNCIQSASRLYHLLADCMQFDHLLISVCSLMITAGSSAEGSAADAQRRGGECGGLAPHGADRGGPHTDAGPRCRSSRACRAAAGRRRPSLAGRRTSTAAPPCSTYSASPLSGTALKIVGKSQPGQGSGPLH